jgi:hypothetical protein
MFVRWRKRAIRPTYWQKKGDTGWSATLVEAKRIDGKVKQVHVAYLGGIRQHHLGGGRNNLAWRDGFWSRAKACLDDLGDRINREERKSIEAVLAEKVRPLSKAERKESERKEAEARAWLASLR